MKDIDILEIKNTIIQDNDQAAERVREKLKEKKVFLVNLMASPGAGKTTLLKRTVLQLKDRYRIGVMEADVDSDVDAKSIQETGVKVIQIHTGGSCHMDADMTLQGVEMLDVSDVDLVFLENIGNLVCPAEFDVGAQLKVMMLSVPEGHDKPLKYPLMFSISDCLIVNKIDTAPVFDFDREKLKEFVLPLNPGIRIISLSAATGEGFDEWIHFLCEEIDRWRKSL